MDTLTFLGTGSGVPMGDRFHTSLLLREGGRHWLIDAGEPCSRTLKSLGVSFSTLDGILISHGHSDHLSGLPMVIQGAWIEGRKRPLPVYLPRELIAPLQGWLNAVYLPEKLVGFAIEYHAWEDHGDQSIQLPESGLSVTTSLTTHLDGLRALIDPADSARFRPYSLALEWLDGRRLVYSGDLGAPSDLASVLARRCNLLVCELAHFSADALFEFLIGKPVERLALTHLSASASEGAATIAVTGKKMLPAMRELSVMHDGDELTF